LLVKKLNTVTHIPEIPGWGLSFNRTVNGHIEHATPSLSWSEGARLHFSYTVAQNLPDLMNPVDHSIWSVLQEKV